MIEIKSNIIDSKVIKCKNKYFDWVDLLCSIGNIDEFKEVSEYSKSEMLAIMKYRKILHKDGKSNVSYIALDTAYKDQGFDKLHKLLEVLFLEHISNEQFDYIIKRLNGTENGLDKIYKLHTQNENARILNVMLKM